MACFLLSNDDMDVNTLKGRIAEAFVEGILRRAGYQVALVGRESRIQHLLKIGRDQFLPDFLVWKPVDDSSCSWPPCRLAGIEVKYRHDIGSYLRRDFASESVKIAAQWPELYFVLVTDQPEPGRSCFQAIRPRAATQDPSTPTVDLHHVAELDIHKRNVEEHERLATQILPLLGSGSGARELPRKPVAKAPAPASPLLRLAR